MRIDSNLGQLGDSGSDLQMRTKYIQKWII